MMMMGSDEGSQPSEAVFFEGNDVFIDIDVIMRIIDGDPDSKDQPSHETLPPNTLEEYLPANGIEDGAFQPVSNISSASHAVTGAETLGFISRNDDTCAVVSIGSEPFSCSMAGEDAEDEYSNPYFIVDEDDDGDDFGVSEKNYNHAIGNELPDCPSCWSLQNHGKFTNDAVPFASLDVKSTINPGIAHDVFGSHYRQSPDEIASNSRMDWPSVGDHHTSVSGFAFTPDAVDRKDDKYMEPSRNPLSLSSNGLPPLEYSASLFHDQHQNILASENNSVLPLHPVKAEVNFSERSPLFLLHSIKAEGNFPKQNSMLPPHSIKAEGNFSDNNSVLPLHSINVESNLADANPVFPLHSINVEGNVAEHNSVLPLHSIKAEGNFSTHNSVLPHHPIKAEINFPVTGTEVPYANSCYSASISCHGVQVNSSVNIDDDSDLCILEDMSTPVFPNSLNMDAKLLLTPQISKDLDNRMSSYSRPKRNDERVIYHLAMEDLAKPRSEAFLPDGFLSVSLLKHQRIALSWMVNKETKAACCSGGILADDQGLGKTISTISLILKERPPTSKFLNTDEWQSNTETLNLEEDGGSLPTFDATGGAQPCNGHPSNRDTTPQSKGRPSGGTLIVCPTSVLRQWSDELHNKVTTKAGLSVLVYYGSNRAKDPWELAMYDVVITTYSIVSMEVPKQQVVEIGPLFGSPCDEVSTCRKRKSSEKCKQSKKGRNGELTENISGPLSKVGWFRVVLDEAQSIKNFRTRTARACWGLRAKRRWCLSGTPIQNTIDDLYSYFRFLRHEPYAIFRTFSEQIKTPISRNPYNGYKKLQAVLRTIMLRRTKDTVIDGEPIINLPPKTVELRKVDFSVEERSFYRRLEVDSQDQFAKYAASGTVNQNYVNILLMLLRLRQACDHPGLVEGFSSKLNLYSSIEAAKALPQESQNFLLNCLEASLALCGLCKDPPEDAVVTICGHVFCNQCIFDHMLGNETLCPAKKCKTHLNKQSVFSKMELHNALSEQPISENYDDCSGDVSKVYNTHSFSCPEDSSKIRAALDLLLSMSPKECSTSSTVTEKNSPCEPGLSSCTSGTCTDFKYFHKVQEGKAIVFSQWTRMLDLLEDCLKRSNLQYRRLDGTMSISARDKAVKDFNNLPEVTIMIMSLKAASLGLNMVAACNVILLDLWWNPTTEDQAIDRAHRIGQTRPVSVFRLTIKDTVEDRILALQEEKRRMVASAFGENKGGSRQSRFTIEELKYLFGV